MTTRLTLTIDKALAAKAAQLAAARNTSVSDIVAGALEKELQQAPTPTLHKDYAPAVSALMGILDLPASYDWKEAYNRHLRQKHG